METTTNETTTKNAKVLSSMANNAMAYLKHFGGTADRMKTIFAFHYDQILRECEQEIFNNGLHIHDEGANDLHDCLVEFMEEQMNWPDPEDLDTFIRDIAGPINAANYDAAQAEQTKE